MILEKKIIDAYYETTSRRTGAVGEDYYRKVSPGLRRRLGAWLPKAGSDVLDLGCGKGGLLYLCQRLGCQSLTGVNLCTDENDEARRFIRATFHSADLLAFLRESKEMYDWIGCLNILEHLTKDEMLETLELCAGRLRSGGSVIVMVPNGASPYGGVTRYGDITHQLAFTPNNFHQLESLCGFSDIEFKECGPIPHGLVSTVRTVLWHGIRLMIKLRLLVEAGDTKGGIYTMDMLVRLIK